MTLKYENKFKVGDKIKALDFAGNDEYWIAGEIVDISVRHGAKMFNILIEEDSMATRAGESRVGDVGFVPMECSLGDKIADNRVTLIEKKMNKEQKEGMKLQARHRVFKQIDWKIAEDRNDSNYWRHFSDPFNELISMLNKKEVFFVLEGQLKSNDTFTTGNFYGEHTKQAMCNLLAFWIDCYSNNMKGIDLNDLMTRCFFVYQNGNGIKI